MVPHRPAALALIAVCLLAGCTSPSGPKIASIDGVGNSSGGDVRLVGNGVRVDPDPANATIALTVTAAEAGTNLSSAGDIDLNAKGPDRDSAVQFWDENATAGQHLAWRDAKREFELSRGVDVLGNVTARHHVGTVTSIIVSTPAQSVVNVATAATEGNEATVFLRGSSTLENGVAKIAFPAPFRVLVGNGPITAQVTATSPGAPLYVSNKSADSIEVRALTPTNASEMFDYFVQATRAASEDFQTVPTG